MRYEEVFEKFHTLCDPLLGEERSREIARRVRALDEFDDLSTLFD